MKRRWAAAGAVLLAALVVGLLVFRQWSGPGRPPSTAERREAPPVTRPARPAAEKPADQVAATPTPVPPAGGRAEFAPLQATPTGQGLQSGATPEVRQRQTPGPATPPADREARRPGPASAPRVQVRIAAPQLADYFRAVSSEVAARWKLPKSVAPRSRTIIPVVLKIARDGRVLWALIEGSSGEAAIDESVARMIEEIKREGLPPLPDDYPYDELDIGLVLNPAGVS